MKIQKLGQTALVAGVVCGAVFGGQQVHAQPQMEQGQSTRNIEEVNFKDVSEISIESIDQSTQTEKGIRGQGVTRIEAWKDGDNQQGFKDVLKIKGPAGSQNNDRTQFDSLNVKTKGGSVDGTFGDWYDAGQSMDF